MLMPYLFFISIRRSLRVFSKNQYDVTEITFGGLFASWDRVSIKPLTPATKILTGIQYQAAFLLAIKEINNKTDGIADELLPNVQILRVVLGAPPQNTYYNLMSAVYVDSYDPLVVIGPDSNEATESLSLWNLQFEIPQIDFAATSVDFNDATIYRYYSRLCSYDSLEAFHIAYMIRNYFDWQRVIVFSSTDDYGMNLLSAFQYGADVMGLELLATYSTKAGITDFSRKLSQASALGCYIFVLLMSSRDTSFLLEQGYKYGTFKEGTQVIGTSQAGTPAVWQAMSASADIPSILKGFMVLTPAAPLDTEAGQAFVKRWRAQPPTVSTTVDGREVCNDETDDFGFYLYRFNKNLSAFGSDNLCLGLDFSAFSADGIDIDTYVPFAYDAVYAAAFAYHNILYNLPPTDNWKSPSIFMSSFRNISFSGVTGNISFNHVPTGFPYAGEGLVRDRGMQYYIMNFNNDLFQGRHNSSGFTKALQLEVDTGKIYSCSSCKPISYNTADNSIPLDRPPITDLTLPKSYLILLYIMFIISILILIIFHGMIIIYWKNKVIKISHPSMLLIMIVGGYVGCLYVILGIFPPSDILCTLQIWSIHISVTTVLSALIAKTWMVSKVFNSGLKKVKVSVQRAWLDVMLILLLVVIILVLDTVLTPPRAITYESSSILNPTRYQYCDQNDITITNILFICEIALMAYGLKLCWDIRKVPDALNESKYIIAGEIIYLLFLLF